eukprot:7814057-Alexandrium_andersonii.AAC.1
MTSIPATWPRRWPRACRRNFAPDGGASYGTGRVGAMGERQSTRRIGLSSMVGSSASARPRSPSVVALWAS